MDTSPRPPHTQLQGSAVGGTVRSYHGLQLQGRTAARGLVHPVFAAASGQNRAERFLVGVALGPAHPGFAQRHGHRARPRDRSGGEVQLVSVGATRGSIHPSFAQRLGHRAGPRDRSGGEVQVLS